MGIVWSNEVQLCRQVEGEGVCLRQAKCVERLDVCTSSNWKRQEHGAGRGTAGSGVAQERQNNTGKNYIKHKRNNELKRIVINSLS